MTHDEMVKSVEADEVDPRFVIGIDPAIKDGDTSVVTFKVAKDRESDDSGEFVWADGKSLSPEERMAKIIADSTEPLPPTHELTDEQLDAEMCMVSRTEERKLEVLDEIKLRAIRKGMETVNEELAVELDESEILDLRTMNRRKREKDEEGRRKEKEAMSRREKREEDLEKILKEQKGKEKTVTQRIFANRETVQDAKNKVFMAIARKAMKERRGFGGGI